MKPGLGKAGDSIDNFSIEKRFTGIITLDKRRNAEVVQKCGPVIRSIHLDEFRERHRTTEIEVRDIDDTEERILRYRSVHDAFNCREVSGGGGNRVLDLDAVTAAGTAYTPDDDFLVGRKQGLRLPVVRMSLRSSAPLRSSQISRLGPERQAFHVRGRPR